MTSSASNPCSFDADRKEWDHPIRDCLSNPTTKKIDVLLTGDSHSMVIADEVGKKLTAHGATFYNVSYMGCIPFRGFRRTDLAPGVQHHCVEYNDSIFDYASSANIKVVILTARFPIWLLDTAYDNGEGGVEPGKKPWVMDDALTNFGAAEQKRINDLLGVFQDRVSEFAKEFKVVLVYPIPEAGWDVPSQSFRAALFGEGGKVSVDTSYDRYKARAKEITALFDRLVANDPNVFGARVHEALCSETTGRCLNADENAIYYFDDDHLSTAGARLVAPIIGDAVQLALGQSQNGMTDTDSSALAP